MILLELALGRGKGNLSDCGKLCDLVKWKKNKKEKLEPFCVNYGKEEKKKRKKDFFRFNSLLEKYKFFLVTDPEKIKM